MKNGKNSKNAGIRKLINELKKPDDIQCKAKNPRDIGALLVLDARIPIEFWSAGWVFRNIFDTTWQSLTKNAETVFPATLRREHKTHPGYIIKEIANYAMDIVPLTSKKHKAPCIPEGHKFSPTGYINSTTSYLVMGAVARISRRGDLFQEKPKFIGIYPPEKLI